MFNRILIDLDVEPRDRESEYFDEREYRLIPFLYLIADHIMEAGTKLNQQDKPDFVEKCWSLSEGRPHIIDYGKNNEGIYFSPLKFRKGMVLKYQGITAQNAMLLLAASGLEITVPNFTFNIARSEEVIRLRSKLEEERQLYLEAIAKMADETYERITSGVYKDTVEWALSEAFLKIKPKAQAFERTIRKLDKNLIERLALDFVSDGIPNIGSVTLKEGISAGLKVAAEEVLKVLSTNLARRIEERKVPEIVYGYKISHELKDNRERA